MEADENQGGQRISRRKADHLDVVAGGTAEFRDVSTLLEHVRLIHHALPEMALADVDLGVTLVGRRLAAPVVVAGMTGGTPDARELNRQLAKVAERLGVAFGLGSQRAMALHPELADTYQVKDVAPGVFLLGNLGAVQARELGVARVRALTTAVGADALCVHLNPAMELVQGDGDRDFRGVLETIGRLVEGLGLPVIVKETGCGLGPQAARALRKAGVTAVDVSGAGGTSWTAVEALRTGDGTVARALGEDLWDWGLPTAVSIAACAAEGLQVIATGGIRSGLDVARALALGATAAGLAAPILRAHRDGGAAGTLQLLEGVIASVRAITLLTGCRRAADLARAPRSLGAPLRDWLRDLGLVP